jgi:hypothetical protein
METGGALEQAPEERRVLVANDETRRSASSNGSPASHLAYVTTRGRHDRYKVVPKCMECMSSNPARSTARSQDSTASWKPRLSG